jgi:cell shape-determining protein MreC
MRLAALGSTVQRAAAPAYSSSRSANALRRRLVAGILVALSLALITGYFRESESGTLHDAQGVAASVLHPFQVGAERVARPFQDAYGWFAGFVHAKSENERLKEQQRRLEQQAIQNTGAARENVRLREMLDYRAGPTFPRGFDTVGAEVIFYRINEFQSPVSSQVILVTDGEFSVSGYDVQTETYGLVSHGQGAGESLVLDLVPKSKRVEKNDLIVTAGRRAGELPSLYPKNIAIGTVTNVGQSNIDIHQSIQVQPLADFSSLSSVLILTPKER